MNKKLLAWLLLLALILTSLPACGQGEATPEWVWQQELLSPLGEMENYTTAALQGEENLAFLLGEQVLSRPLAAAETAPSPVCTLGRTEFNFLCVDEAGNFWAANYGGWVCAYTPTGETLYEYCFPSSSGISSVTSLFALPGGGAGCTIGTLSNTYKTYAFDLDAPEPRELAALTQENTPLYFAGPAPDGAALLGWDDTQIFRLPYENPGNPDKPLEERMETVVTLEDCGLAGMRLTLLGMPQEDCLILVNHEAEAVLALKRLPADQAPEKESLTLGIYGSLDQEIAAGIAVFNLENQDVQIKPVVYTDFTQMTVEFTAGKFPDLLVSDTIPFEEYAAKGLFEDLYSYIEADGLELVQPALKAMETDGALYRLTPGFSINTLVGNSDYAGTEMGWTWAEFQAALAAAPEGMGPFPSNWTREMAYGILLVGTLDQYVDWTAGTARFESEEFKGLLEWAGQYPVENTGEHMREMEMLAQGVALAKALGFNSFGDFATKDNQLSGKMACKGYPGEARCTGTLCPAFTFSITTNCQDKDTAWRFIAQFLQADYQPPYVFPPVIRFPMNRELFDAQAEESMSIGYQYPEYLGMDPSDVMTQSQYDKCMALLESIDSTGSGRNEDLLEIVQEETDIYFAGQRGLDETCAIIQNRAETYISERMG